MPEFLQCHLFFSFFTVVCHWWCLPSIFWCTSGITRLNDRARQDVAVLGLGFLKLDGIPSYLNSMIYTWENSFDLNHYQRFGLILWVPLSFPLMCLCQCCLKARARKDTEKIKIDLGVKEKAAHLHRIATVCFHLLCSSSSRSINSWFKEYMA